LASPPGERAAWGGVLASLEGCSPVRWASRASVGLRPGPGRATGCVEQPAQRRLVAHRSVQDRLHRLDGRAQALKRRQQEVAQLPLDPDLVVSSASGHERLPSRFGSSWPHEG